MSNELSPIDLATFEARIDQYDAAVDRVPGIDRFCTSSAWILPAHRALMPSREPLVLHGDAGWVVLAQGFHRGVGRYLEPFEAAWGLACPLVGDDPERLVAALMEAMAERTDWRVMVFSGLLIEGPWRRVVIEQLGRRWRVGEGGLMGRRRASLVGGLDGFLSRRSSKFRANLRRAGRRAREAGLTLERVAPGEADADALYRRILDVEARSWKGRQGGGLADPAMQGFYARMLPRLARRDALRAVFVREGERDVAFCFGGIHEDIYRGLQMSYDEAWRKASLGSVAQLEMIELLAEEGVHTYDLGQDIPYKVRWSDENLESIAVYALR